MSIIQLDFFENNDCEIVKLKQEFAAIKESTNKVRRGLFARHGELSKLYLELNDRLSVLERNLCRPAISYDTDKVDAEMM
jgi:hypothetical protein